MLKKSIQRLLVLSLVGNLLTGCSGMLESVQLSEDLSPPLTNKQHQDLLELLDKQNEREELLAQWKKNKEGVARLLAIETDLKTLIEQLSQLTEGNDVAGSSNQIMQQDTSSLTESPLNSVPAPHLKLADQKLSEPYHVSENNDVFFVQLSAMNKVENIVGFWQELVKKQPNLFASLHPLTERVELTNGYIYRLKAGKFSNVGEANGFCNKLRILDIPCIVSHYSENTILVPLQLN